MSGTAGPGSARSRSAWLSVQVPAGTCTWDQQTILSDKNVNLEANGHPCRDQIGRAADLDDDGVQDAEPLYEWNNTFDGDPASLLIDMCAESIEHIQEGRDYHSATTRPDYTPYVYPHPLAPLDP